MSEPFRILLIDDNPDDRALVLRQLEREFNDLQVEQITDARGFEGALERGGFGLVITDYRLMWTTGLSILRTAKARWPDCPVVMFTGTGGEEIAVEAMKAGLDDYVLKSPRHFVRLPIAARTALDRARQRRAVKESEERYWRLFDGLPIGLYLSSPEGQAIDANPVLAEMLGFPDRDSFLDCVLPSLYVDPEDRRRWLEAIGRDGVVRNFEVRLRKHDGTTIWVKDTARAEQDDSGRARYFEGSLEDITERKRAEEQLRLLESAVRNAGESIVITTAEDRPESARIVFANPAFTRMTGYPAREAVGRSPWILAGPRTDPDALARLAEAMRLGKVCEAELACRRQDGAEFQMQWHLTPIRGQDERITHFVSIQRDVTERNAIAERLRHSQKMEAVGRLAGGIAHDFNNILTVIGGYGDILREAVPDDAPLRRHVDTIVEAAERAVQLTQQLLTFSRRQILEPMVHDLNRIVSDMSGLLGRLLGEDVRLEMRLDPGLGPVRVDAGQIGQVVVNLAVNARDAMEEGGTLRIETSVARIDELTASRYPGLPPGAYAKLDVADSGHGMDAATVDRIFEPFFTTKESGRGTGLGLSTVYGIVQQSGGNIRVRSSPGHGTTFEILLPLVLEESAPGTTLEAATAPRGGSETILLVEDERSIRDLLQEILENAGYQVLVADGGADALRVTETYPDPIDLLLTDVVMPGMSGRDLAERLSAVRPHARVLFISGYTNDEVVRRGVSTSDFGYLQKPFPPQSLLRKVREVLES